MCSVSLQSPCDDGKVPIVGHTVDNATTLPGSDPSMTEADLSAMLPAMLPRLGLLVRTGPLAGNAATGSDGMSPWVAAAVSCQRLYTRDTVEFAQLDATTSAKVIDDVRTKDRLDVYVPDLSRAGLQIKTIQRLSFNGKPLVQIVHLPQTGAPISLCVIGDPKPDTGVIARSVNTIHVITWRYEQNSDALIVNTDSVHLETLRTQIAESDIGDLLGMVALPLGIPPNA